MKVAFWTTYPGGGGSEVLWHRIAGYLVENGDEIFCALSNREPNARFIQLMQSKNATLEIRAPGATFMSKVARKLGWQPGTRANRPIGDFEPDILIINSDGVSWIADQELIASLKQMKVPYIVILHGTGGFIEDPLRDLAREFYLNAKHVCFVSEYTCWQVERHLAVKLPNARIIRNTVNPQIDTQQPIPFPDLSDRLQMATASRLQCYTKGHDYLFEALADPAIRGKNFICKIYGDGPHRTYLSELIKYFGLEKKVELMGHSNGIIDIWKTSHLHIMPSIVESAPIALVEAMLCGRPTVATRVAGIPEWLDDEKSGYIVENANPWNLVPGLQKALNNRDKLREMGFAAHLKAKALYGDPIKDFLQLINEPPSSNARAKL